MRRPGSPRVVVIGAGLAGLSAALALAARGVSVTVVERAATPGGKMRQAVVGDARIDAGPTVLTMRWILDELLELAGERLEQHLALHPLDVLAGHAWDADSRLCLYADEARSAEAIAAFAGPAEARGYRDFCARARAAYAALEPAYLRQPAPSVARLVGGVGLRGLGGLWRSAPFSTLWQALGQHFRDPRLRQLFGRYATYCGSSPFLAPATLMIIAHVEQLGVWRVEGGMYRIAETLADCAARLGARFRYASEATRLHVRGGKVVAACLSDGEEIAADAVVFNGDPAAFAQHGFGLGPAGPRAVRAGGTPSLSAVTWSMRARVTGFPLTHHTVFFSPDYAAEFAELRARRLPTTPTVYVCAQDRGDAIRAAGDEAERVFLLVNAPALVAGARVDDAAIAACERRTFAHLEACGLALAPDAAGQVRTAPADFAALFPGSGGALYGRATHGWRASFARSRARARMRGLYLAGGAIHPGAGVPMAMLSGRYAAAAVLEDLAMQIPRRGKA